LCGYREPVLQHSSMSSSDCQQVPVPSFIATYDQVCNWF